MKKENGLALGISEPDVVDDYMKVLKHPLANVAGELRQVIRSIDKNIGEGIYWNAPTFFYTGKMKPFDPKDYKRYIAGFVFNRQDMIRLVFLRGAFVDDKSGFLEGTYKDGRRLATFSSVDDVKTKEEQLTKTIRKLVQLIRSEQ